MGTATPFSRQFLWGIHTLIGLNSDSRLIRFQVAITGFMICLNMKEIQEQYL